MTKQRFCRFAYFNGAPLSEGLGKTQSLIMAEIVKELFALCGRLPSSNLPVDLAPGPAPLPQSRPQVADILLRPVLKLCAHTHTNLKKVKPFQIFMLSGIIYMYIHGQVKKTTCNMNDEFCISDCCLLASAVMNYWKVSEE